MIWNLINTGYQRGLFNMEFDEKEAINLSRSEGNPVLRFYGWKPYAISIGYHQRIEDFDIDKIYAAGIDIVRRPTGGRAILHADEVTYSVIMKMENETPKSIYKFINEGLLHGLRYLSVDAELSDKGENFPELYRQTNSIPCFSSTAKSEIKYRNKKLVGSAQRRYGNVILQHGSILLGPYHKKIVDFLSPNLSEQKEMLKKEIELKTIDLQEITGRHISFDEAVDALTQGFADRHGIFFQHTEFIENI